MSSVRVVRMWGWRVRRERGERRLRDSLSNGGTAHILPDQSRDREREFLWSFFSCVVVL